MKRPLGVTILGVLTILQGVLVTALGLVLPVLAALHVAALLPPGLVVVVEYMSVVDVLMAAAQFALGVFAVVSGIGMLRLRPWAWLMAMLLLGCELLIQLGSYFRGSPNYVLMLIDALLILYLNQRPIREAFLLEPKPAEPSTINIQADVNGSAVGAPEAS